MKLKMSAWTTVALIICSLIMVISCRHHNRIDDHQQKNKGHRHHKGRCMRCPVGWGVKLRCDFKKSPERDTVCEPCSRGTYSAHHSFKRGCYPCSRCGIGLYVAHPCTPTRDTVCDSCLTVKGPKNEDFVARCVNHTYASPEFAKSLRIKPHIISGKLYNSALTSSVKEHFDVTSHKKQASKIEGQDGNKGVLVTVVATLAALATIAIVVISISCWRSSKSPKKICFQCKSKHKYHEIHTHEDLAIELQDEDVSSC